MMTHAPASEAETRTFYRTCPLCEATCGLELTLEGDRVVRVQGDKQDVFSQGYFCPKGGALGKLHHDPDRLTRPVVREGEKWREVSWDQAFEAVEKGLMKLVHEHGPDSVGVFLGNPNVHTMAGSLYVRPFLKALKSKSVFTSSTVDQMPKHVACGYMFGHPAAIPVPDIDRTDYLLILGGNPLASNGSMCTAPGFPNRLQALKDRGGRLVVIDPKLTRTAAMAHEHHFIRPGTDPLLLLAMVNTLFEEDLVSLGLLAEHVEGVARVEEAARPFGPETVSRVVGIEADVIRRLTREMAKAPSAAVYGRMGTSTVSFGTLASWLVDVVNILTGNLDRPGGAMFPCAAHSRPRNKPGGKGFVTGRWQSRVRGLDEVLGELPVAALAEEIETPGQGQVKGLVTVAGNPVITTPNSRRLDAALAGLEFMVSVDFYINETTRHADVILPPRSPLASGHYDFAMYGLAVRNVARYSPPVVEDPGGRDKWEILAKLALIVSGQGAAADPSVLDDFVLSFLAGKEAEAIKAGLGDRRGPERMLDLMLRNGPYDLTFDRLLENPHGLDLGPLQPRVPEILQNPNAKIDLGPSKILADVSRLEAGLEAGPPQGLMLIGRRHLRTNNSWMYNVEGLAVGRVKCTLQVHPDDARALGLSDGERARVLSSVGQVTAPVEFTDKIMPGVVSLPHGWGHDVPGTKLSVARTDPGINSNVLADETLIDPLSGNAVLNGIPVRVEPA
jgi:anaerobic selenocysteine-containing dehydrogenase